jgi:hypothetical protein
VEKRQVQKISFVLIVVLTYRSRRSNADANGNPERVRVLDLPGQVVAYGEPFQGQYFLSVLECYGTSIGGGQASSF